MSTKSTLLCGKVLCQSGVLLSPCIQLVGSAALCQNFVEGRKLFENQPAQQPQYNVTSLTHSLVK